ncbi:MAG: hypothetical protein [Sanya atkins-like virus 2]|nr:MAG: hypothetical protein [Sanya atkins-like virus 2]
MSIILKIFLKALLKDLFEAADADFRTGDSTLRVYLSKYLEDWQIAILFSALTSIIYEEIRYDVSDSMQRPSLPAPWEGAGDA